VLYFTFADHCHEKLDIPDFYETFKEYAMKKIGRVDEEAGPREMGKYF